MEKEKVVLMTKLAVYDKHQGEKDRKIMEHFRHDYIYRKNMWTRVFAVIATIIIFAGAFFNSIFVQNIDLFSTDFKALAYQISGWLIFVIIIYTVIGTIIYGKEYIDAENRTKRYFSIVGKLERMK